MIGGVRVIGGTRVVDEVCVGRGVRVLGVVGRADRRLVVATDVVGVVVTSAL
ncbi:hypothetical protein ACFQ9X_11425 [Catenulispora yoronensis]